MGDGEREKCKESKSIDSIVIVQRDPAVIGRFRDILTWYAKRKEEMICKICRESGHYSVELILLLLKASARNLRLPWNCVGCQSALLYYMFY